MKAKSLMLVTAYAVTTFISLPTVAEQQLSLTQRVEMLEQQAQNRNQIQSQMSSQLVQLQKEVKELRGFIEEHDYKLQQIQERQRDLYRDIDNRFSAIQKAPGQSPAAINSGNVSPSNSSITNQVKQVIASDDGRAEFEASFALVRNKQYPEAIKGFESFLKKYPTGNYSDNARFWIGQVYFAQSNLVEAEKQFSLLRSEFPDSSKLSSAILKLAEINVKQGKWQQAKALYNEVVTKFTGTPQQLARKGLQDIKASGH